jgi:hypothetical protein
MRCAPHHAIRVSYRSRLIAGCRRRWRNLTHQKTGLSKQRTYTQLTSPSVEIFVGKLEGLFIEMSVRVCCDVEVKVTRSCTNIVFSNIYCLMRSQHTQNHSHKTCNFFLFPTYSWCDGKCPKAYSENERIIVKNPWSVIKNSYALNKTRLQVYSLT